MVIIGPGLRVALSATVAAEGLVVTGGPGGTVAQLEDLDRSATALDSAARSLDAAWWALTRIGAKLEEWSAPRLDPSPEQARMVASARTACVPVEALRHDPAGVRALAQDMRDAASRVRSAKKGYERAESLADAAWRRFLRQSTDVLSRSPTGWGLFVLVTTGSLLLEAQKWRSGGPYPGDRLQHTVYAIASMIRNIGTLPGFGDDDPVPAAAGRLAFLARASNPRSEVRVEPVLGSGGETRPPRGVEDLLRPLQENTTYTADGSVHGAGIVVTKVRREDGTTAWTVTIPGTQRMAFGGDEHPFDNLSNLEAMSGAVSDSERAVRAAMEAAGIGPDDPVVLTGHSQGGLVAQRIAQSGAFAVAAVLTVGSPTGAGTMKATVPTLHVEHGNEPVASLDGRPNRDDRLTTTVSRDTTDMDVARDPSAIHSVTEYLRTAQAIDGSEEASVMAWKKVVEDVLGPGVAAESRTYAPYRVTR